MKNTENNEIIEDEYFVRDDELVGSHPGNSMRDDDDRGNEDIDLTNHVSTTDWMSDEGILDDGSY